MIMRLISVAILCSGVLAASMGLGGCGSNHNSASGGAVGAQGTGANGSGASGGMPTVPSGGGGGGGSGGSDPVGSRAFCKPGSNAAWPSCDCAATTVVGGESLACTSESFDGAVCKPSGNGERCSCTKYGCFTNMIAPDLYMCSCGTISTGKYPLTDSGCTQKFDTYCLNPTLPQCKGATGCDAANGEISVPSCDAADILPLLARSQGFASDCSLAVVGQGGVGDQTLQPDACQGVSSPCTKHEDCCGYDAGGVSCHGTLLPNGHTDYHCENACASNADCGSLCCTEYEPGHKACEVCPPVCDGGDSSVHKPPYAGPLCEGCLQDNCCPQLKNCDLACFQCALHNQSCTSNPTFAAVTACMQKSCASECKEPKCNEGNCTGCDYPGNGVVCCHKCVSDSCDYQCTL